MVLTTLDRSFLKLDEVLYNLLKQTIETDGKCIPIFLFSRLAPPWACRFTFASSFHSCGWASRDCGCAVWSSTSLIWAIGLCTTRWPPTRSHSSSSDPPSWWPIPLTESFRLTLATKRTNYLTICNWLNNNPDFVAGAGWMDPTTSGVLQDRLPLLFW